MLNRRGARGFSVINLLLVFGALIVSVWIYKAWVARREREATAKVVEQQANILRDRLLEIMRQETAWKATLNHPQNATALACLLQHTNCLAKDGTFILRDNLNRQIYDPTIPTNGFNPEGYPCSTFSDGGNDSCPYRVELHWKGDCDDECVDPATVTLSGKLRFRPAPNGGFAGITLKDQEFKTSVRVRSDEPRNCYDLLKAGHTRDGLYPIKFSAGSAPVTIYCDQTRDGGGWALAVSAATTTYKSFPESGALSPGVTGRIPSAVVRAYLDTSSFQNANNLRLELPEVDGGFVLATNTAGDIDAEAYTARMPKTGDCRSLPESHEDAAHKTASTLSLFFSGSGELGLDDAPENSESFQGFRICFGTTKEGRNCGIGCNRKWTGDLKHQKGQIWIR